MLRYTRLWRKRQIVVASGTSSWSRERPVNRSKDRRSHKASSTATSLRVYQRWSRRILNMRSGGQAGVPTALATRLNFWRSTFSSGSAWSSRPPWRTRPRLLTRSHALRGVAYFLGAIFEARPISGNSGHHGGDPRRDLPAASSCGSSDRGARIPWPDPQGCARSGPPRSFDNVIPGDTGGVPTS